MESELREQWNRCNKSELSRNFQFSPLREKLFFTAFVNSLAGMCFFWWTWEWVLGMKCWRNQGNKAKTLMGATWQSSVHMALFLPVGMQVTELVKPTQCRLCIQQVCVFASSVAWCGYTLKAHQAPQHLATAPTRNPFRVTIKRIFCSLISKHPSTEILQWSERESKSRQRKVVPRETSKDSTTLIILILKGQKAHFAPKHPGILSPAGNASSLCAPTVHSSGSQTVVHGTPVGYNLIFLGRQRVIKIR